MAAARGVQLSFADQIYEIYKIQRKTALTREDVMSGFVAQYNVSLDISRLNKLPFILFERVKGDHHNQNLIYLLIELDDICDECTSDCRLLHGVDRSDRFKMIYPQRAHHNNFNKHRYQKKSCDIYREIPNICLMDRIKSILYHEKRFTKKVSLTELIRIHNERYPQFASHAPTQHGIALRFKNTFHIRYDNYFCDYVIALNHIFPEQSNKHCLSVALHKEWHDFELIPELMDRITGATRAPIADIYINSTVRLGFFTCKNQAIAEQFVQETAKQKMKCWGRTVMAELVPIPKNNTYQQKGYRVKVDNVNAVIPEKEFERWVHKMTKTLKQKQLISDVVLIYPKRQKGISQCIVLFNTREDAAYVRKKMNRCMFRGETITVEHCVDYSDRNVLHKSKPSRANAKGKCPPGLSLPPNAIAITTKKRIESEAVYDMGHIKADESLKSSPKSITTSHHSLKSKSVDTQQQTELIRKLQVMKREMDDMKKKKKKKKTESLSDAYDIEEWNQSMERMKREILCKLNTQTFGTVLSQIIETVQQTQRIEQMESIIAGVLTHGVHNEALVDLCVNLCGHLIDDCVDLHNEWILNEEDISKTITEIIVNQTRSLFVEFKSNRMNDARSFIGVMVLIAELYNVGLFKINLVFKGVIDSMISAPSEVEIEAICKLFIKCMTRLDEEDKWSVDHYLEILSDHIKTNTKHRLNALLDTLKQQRYDALEQKYNELASKYDANKAAMNTVMDNHKVLQMRYNELQQKYTENTKKTDYMLWNAQEVADWIVDLNRDRYSKYYHVLLENMSNECIDGSCLQNLDKNDLHRLGITQFKDKVAVYSEIAQFISKVKVMMRNTLRIKACTICQENIGYLACVPCGHLCVCSQCKDKANMNGLCPICQQKYQSLQPIHP